MIDVAWINEEQLDETREAEGFIFTRLLQETLEQTLTLVPSSDEGDSRFLGSYSRREQFLLEMTETDEWDGEVVGTNVSLMEESSQFFTWVEGMIPKGATGFVSNGSLVDNCPGTICEIRVNEDCTRRFAVEAVLLEAGGETFDALEQYDQPDGLL